MSPKQKKRWFYIPILFFLLMLLFLGIGSLMNLSSNEQLAFIGRIINVITTFLGIFSLPFVLVGLIIGKPYFKKK